jgi:hypothetical protein
MLYPRGFISNDSYRIAKNQDQIVQLSMFYFNLTTNNQISSYKSNLPMEQISPIKKIQNIDKV